jgi:hypothetical protein
MLGHMPSCRSCPLRQQGSVYDELFLFMMKGPPSASYLGQRRSNVTWNLAPVLNNVLPDLVGFRFQIQLFKLPIWMKLLEEVEPFPAQVLFEVLLEEPSSLLADEDYESKDVFRFKTRQPIWRPRATPTEMAWSSAARDRRHSLIILRRLTSGRSAQPYRHSKRHDKQQNRMDDHEML